MNRKKVMTKLTTGLFISTLIVSMGSVSFARSEFQAANGIFNQRQRIESGVDNGQKQSPLKAVLEEKVKKGTITQEQADKLMGKMCPSKEKAHFRNKDMVKSKVNMTERKAQLEGKLAEKVAQGKLTKEEAEKILKKIEMKGDSKDWKKKNSMTREERIKSRITRLERKLTEAVEEKTITQVQADEILKAVKERIENKSNR